MRNKLLTLFVAMCSSLFLFAQSDTVQILRSASSPNRTAVSEQTIPMEDTPELQETPDSLVLRRFTTIHHYVDTLITVVSTPDSTAKQREEITYADSADRRGSYVEAHLGLGIGSLGYQLRSPDCSTGPSFSAQLQIQYAQFLSQNWGFGIGLWFTNYTSFAHLGGSYVWNDQTDTDLEQHYDHTSTVVRWRERETIHNLAIPVSAQFQYKKDSWNARLFAALGLAPAFSVSRRYRVLEGEVAHSGYYPKWNLTLDDVHEFGVKDYTNEPCARGKLRVSPQVSLFADCGALLPMTPQVDFFIGGYFNVSLNDANRSEKKALGWKDDTFTFMEEYKGAYATDMASASHPWEAGFKVGVHWHYIAPPKHEIIDYFDYFTVRDTTVDMIAHSDTLVREQVDTLIRENIRKAAEEVERFNKIYFDYDSYLLREESKSYLSSIVGVLNKVPEAKIAIDGHASQEGSRWHNERLAYNRAKAVAKYLVEQGIDPERVIVVGHGSLVPNDENVNHELTLDRRVEVKVVQKQSDVEQ